MSNLIRTRLGTRSLAAVCLLALIAVAGCGGGGKEAKNQIVGKVTMDGKPVNGAVVFVGSDNKEYSSPIGSTDGTYQVMEAPNGNMKVYIKGNLAGAGGKLVEPPKAGGGTDMPKGLGGGSGVDAPKKYSSAASTDLTFEVKGGKQEYNITLTP